MIKQFQTVDALSLQNYITAITRSPKFELNVQHGHAPFITISRQSGAGGHTLAEAILFEMKRPANPPLHKNWQVLDQELCQIVLNDPKLKTSMDALMTEKFHSEMEDYLSQWITGKSSQFAIHKKFSKIIRAFAASGKVILIGRAASILTQDMPGGLHVRLIASHESRVHRLMQQRALSRKQAEQQIKEQDYSRAALIKTYFNKNIEDPLLYDAIFNTDRVPMQEIALWLIKQIPQKLHEIEVKKSKRA